ncbi:Nn.00g038110.m01.CDS01 [Neocucurbitaria sp. VM-36]
MDPSVFFRQLLRTPAFCRTAFISPARPQGRTFALLAPSLPHSHPRFLSLPRIIQPSFWTSMVPKPIRGYSEQPKPREWNPATPYIILGLLVGSQAIQILWLKQERGHSLRKAEAKIGILREIIERVQRGEDVPVEKVLGTGDVASEREWAEVLKDIEDEEILFQSKKRRKALRQAAAEAEDKRQLDSPMKETNSEPAKLQVEDFGGAKFY